MCYHTSFTGTPIEIMEAMTAPFPFADDYEPYFHANGFAHPNAPVLSMENGRSINLYNWGLIPFWVKDWESAKKLRNQTLNAKSEEVFEKASYRDSIKSRRCIIPVTGFYESKHVGKEKIPYFIHPKEGKFFNLAGIYSHWTDPATKDGYTTFSILTAEANKLMSEIHNSAKRMPLMIDTKYIDAWISNDLPKAGIVELMQPYDDSNMLANSISKDLNSPKVNSNVPTIMQEVDYGTI